MSSSGGAPPAHINPGISGQPEQSQPVDLVTTKSQPQLRIPTIPAPMRPSSIGVPPRVPGVPGVLAVRGPGRPAPALLAVPKTSTQVNLAVMPGNRVTVLTSATPAKATPLTGPVPKATATTIIRPPTSTFPMTIRTPNSVLAGGGTTSIRLTTTSGASGSNPPVQFVPAAALRPQVSAQGGLPVSVRPVMAGGAVSVRASGFRGAGSMATDAVRVTLVQSPGGSKGPHNNPTQLVQSPAVPKVHSSATLTNAIYKPVTISTQPQPKLIATPPVRIGTIPTSRMTVMPASNTAGMQAVSLAPSHISVPMAHMAKQAAQHQQARGMPPGKLITVATPNQIGSPANLPATPQGVTIQKTSLPVLGSAASLPVSLAGGQQPGIGGQAAQRTISLPYGATQVAAISKPISQAIPVARVCPQPLASGGPAGPNLVTITSSVTTGSINPAVTGPQGQSVYIARPGGQNLQPVAINLTSPQHHQPQPQSVSFSSRARPTTGPGDNQQQMAKISLPTQPTRLIVPSVQDADTAPSKGVTNARPSILRRREADRDITSDTPPPRPDSRNDDAGSSSSGSATLSATSSPGLAGDRANLSGGEEPAMQPSPRKKPRKQTLSSTARGDPAQWGEVEDFQEEGKSPLKMRRLHDPVKAEPAQPVANYINDKPHMSLINSYRHTWKSRHNHFLRHADVRSKEEPRPTVNELANQKHILQKINGWKIYHLTSQMEDVVDMEAELTSRLSSLQKRLDKHALQEANKDVGKIQELIKANLQRSRVIQDQIQESKDHALELFEHKAKVTDILHKYMSKRHVKKREIGKM